MEIINRMIEAHKSIYSAQAAERQIEIDMAVPTRAVDDDTILLVLIPGFGGSYRANIFQKILKTFPDKYNCIVVTGDYFGNKNMVNPEKISIDIKQVNTMGDYYPVPIDETEEEFCDMGVMQGMDIVYMTKAALEYVGKDTNELAHVIAFGSSHGAYLAHLANLLCEGLFSYIIDISGYITPYYRINMRKLAVESACCRLILGWEYYLYTHETYHHKLYDLSYLYRYNEKTCRIIAFQGNEDWMVDYREKVAFINSCGNGASAMLLTAEDVDGAFIKNANHGLGMDFLILFEMLLPMICESKRGRKELPNQMVTIGDGDAKIVIDHSGKYPEIVEISEEREGIC